MCNFQTIKDAGAAANRNSAFWSTDNKGTTAEDWSTTATTGLETAVLGTTGSDGGWPGTRGGADREGGRGDGSYGDNYRWRCSGPLYPRASDGGDPSTTGHTRAQSGGGNSSVTGSV
uniref:Uncharacterized protein n=1 Tax=Leersia perrieri TaxID=77586 RepID=A0A0D9VVG8_9ORYZ